MHDFDELIEAKTELDNKNAASFKNREPCKYPMPTWSKGICGCKLHNETEHEAIVKRIEARNGKPFDTKPDRFELVTKINPWKGKEEYYVQEVKNENLQA